MPSTRKQNLSVLEALGTGEKAAHEEYQDDDWDESSQKLSQQKKRGRPRKKQKALTRPTERGKQKESNANESSDQKKKDDDSVEREVFVPRRRRASPSNTGAAPETKRLSIRESPSSSENKQPIIQSKKKSTKLVSRNSTHSESDEEFEQNAVESEQEESSSASNVLASASKSLKKQTPKRVSRSRADEESDEDFDPNAVESEQEDESASFLEDEESSSDDVKEVVKSPRKSSPQKQSESLHKKPSSERRESVGYVLEGDVGVAEDSSDDSIIASPPPKLHLQPSPKRRSYETNNHLKYKPKTGTKKAREDSKPSPIGRNRRESIGLVLDGDVGDVDDSGDDSIIASRPSTLHPQPSTKRQSFKTTTPRKRKPTKAAKKTDEDSSEGYSSSSSVISARPKDVPQCDSKVDIITGEKLPKIHVCFFAPDQQSCQCFALETLRKIALSASAPQYRKENTGRQVQTFLQPPHFRTPMSDDLIDQIASRFGRDALNIHGNYYSRQAAAIPNAPTDWSNIAMPIMPDRDDNFHDQLQQYIRNTMGSQDVYACPLCYIVAHSRFVSDETDAPYETEFRKDPMAVLGYLDNDDFSLASGFCFRKVANLKRHLRQDHHVQTKGIQGNSFYSRYKIRAQDGLLQRYLKRTSGKNWAPRQGDMMRYWYFGNNHNFLLLLDHMREAEQSREVVRNQRNHAEDEVAEAQSSLRPLEEYFESFTDDVNDIWDNITSPFRRATQDELDFVANDSYEEEDGDEVGNHLALYAQSEIAEFQRRQSTDVELAARYENMEKQLRRKEQEESGSASDGLTSNNDQERSYNQEDSGEDDDSFKREIERKRKVSPPKKTARRHRQTQSNLDGFMAVAKKQEVIALDDDSSSAEEISHKSGNSERRSPLRNYQDALEEEDDDPIVFSANRRKKRFVIGDDD